MNRLGILLAASAGLIMAAPPATGLRIAAPANWTAHPLDPVTIVGAPGTTLLVRDGAGRVYQRLPVAARITFAAGGSLGKQTVEAIDPQGKVLDSASFTLEAASGVDDNGGAFSDLFRITEKTMRGEQKDGVGEITYKGRVYHYLRALDSRPQPHREGHAVLQPGTRRTWSTCSAPHSGRTA